jgi:hypothetical protein
MVTLRGQLTLTGGMGAGVVVDGTVVVVVLGAAVVVVAVLVVLVGCVCVSGVGAGAISSLRAVGGSTVMAMAMHVLANATNSTTNPIRKQW